MEYEEKILNLEKNGCIRTADVVKENIPRVYLTKMVDDGILKRVSRGLYTTVNDIVDEYIIIQNKSDNLIFSNLTSLYLQGLSNRLPIKYDVTVLSNYSGELAKDSSVNLFYVSSKVFNLGVKKYKLPSGYEIKIYDKERSICDIIKNKNRLDAELVNKAIRDYFYSNDKDILKLYSYAKELKVYNKVRSILEVLS